MTAPHQLRQGLPRVRGGAPWPSGAVSAELQAETDCAAPLQGFTADRSGAAPAVTEPAGAKPAEAKAAVSNSSQLRRGLPRERGGAPWPVLTEETGVVPYELQPSAPIAHEAPALDARVDASAAAGVSGTAANVGWRPGVGVPLRRGLPRLPGGEPWPPESAAPAARAEAILDPVASRVRGGDTPAAPTSVPDLAPASGTTAPAAAVPVAAPAAPVSSVVSATAGPPAAPITPGPTERQKTGHRSGSRIARQWGARALLWAGGAIVATAMIVLAARGVTTLPGVPEFLERHPGEYESPVPTDPGFPAWARWSHFLNFFFMVLIVRTGLLVRHQQKPPAFFTPKRGGKKISLHLWLHTSIDLLWMLNGVVFVTLLFVSGHWARIVPTSWEVVPNAASAMLQYLTLEWPTENGWVNYNSLQQIMYFTVVFIAAPLAAISGVRMSEWWPKNAERLNRWYPAALARTIHFPVMLFFVLFVVVHVTLVLATGALRNLNHMFVGTDAVSWAGFWWFAAGLLVAAAVTWAAKPQILAPIASAFGKVSNR